MRLFFCFHNSFYIFHHNSTKLPKIRTYLLTEFDRLFILFMIILAYSIDYLIHIVKGGRIMRVGFHRKVDNLGRITIPKEYREFFHLNEQDTVCLIDTTEGLLITNPKFTVVEVSETNDKCYKK